MARAGFIGHLLQARQCPRLVCADSLQSFSLEFSVCASTNRLCTPESDTLESNMGHLPVGSVTLGKLLHLYEPVSLSVKWVDDNISFKKLLED